MATYTENYNLTMPEESDYYHVEDYNENFETIDALMAENERATAEINEKLGTPNEGETVFSLLKSGGSFIKSIQRVTYSIPANKTSGSCTINKVDTSKCIVIFERLHSNFSIDTKMIYTLNATSITFEHEDYAEVNLKSNLFGFWIIEFN